MTDNSSHDEFVRELAKCHQPLYAYIYAQVPRVDAADDIFQETMLALWKTAIGERGDGPIRNFNALSREVARYQVMTYLKKKKRNRLCFSDGLLSLLAEEAAEHVDRVDARRSLLDACIAELSPQSREALRMRYSEEAPLPTIARKMERSTAAVTQLLYRTRNALAACIKRRESKGADR